MLRKYESEEKRKEKEIRNKAIDEFAEALRLKCLDSVYKEVSLYTVLKIAEQLKAGE